MEEHEIAEIWKAQILAWLYERRPRKLDISNIELGAATGVGPVDEPDEFFEDLLDWLIEENLIRSPEKHRTDGQAFSVQLTAKAQGQMQKAEDGLLGQVTSSAGSVGKTLLGKATSAAFDVAWAVLKTRYGLDT